MAKWLDNCNAQDIIANHGTPSEGVPLLWIIPHVVWQN